MCEEEISEHREKKTQIVWVKTKKRAMVIIELSTKRRRILTENGISVSKRNRRVREGGK